MANFEDIDKARRLLGLGEEATIEEIKSAYRKMAFHHHMLSIFYGLDNNFTWL